MRGWRIVAQTRPPQRERADPRPPQEPSQRPPEQQPAQQPRADEDQRKGSIEQRGAAVVTTSGVLIALLFGFAGFTTTAPGFRAAGATGLLLAFALVAFLIAAVLGILSNWL